MFNIPRRKVLLQQTDRNYSNNSQQRSNIHEMLSSRLANKPMKRDDYGYERMKLVQYVGQEFDRQHKDDADILDKFRRQAQQQKRKKYQQKRRAYKNRLLWQEEDASHKYSQSKMRIESIQQQENASKHIQNVPQSTAIPINNAYDLQYPFYPPPPQQVVFVKDQKHSKSKEKLKKKLKKKTEELIVARRKIHHMKETIQQLQHQRDIKHTYDNNRSIEEMEGLIQDLSGRILQNGLTINRNVMQLQDLNSKHKFEPLEGMYQSNVMLRNQSNIPTSRIMQNKSMPYKLQIQPKDSLQELQMSKNRPIIHYSLKNPQNAFNNRRQNGVDFQKMIHDTQKLKRMEKINKLILNKNQ